MRHLWLSQQQEDVYKRQILMDKTRIDVDCILDIDGQIYEIANESETDFD